MSAFCFMHLQKFKANDLGGMRNHLERFGESHTNLDIDREKSHLNYSIDGANARNLIKDTNKRIAELNKKKSVRKDAVVMVGGMVTASPEKLESMSEAERKAFFEDAAKFFVKEFGAENIRFAKVHLDEKTPHLHIGFTPIINGKLCAKEVMSRDRLRGLQDRFWEQVGQKFGMERGERDTKRKHLSVEQYKRKQNEETEKRLVTKEKALNSILSDIADLPNHTKTMKSVFNKAIKASSRDERNFYLKKSASVIDTIAKAIDDVASTANVAMQLSNDSLGIDKDWNLMSELEREELETKAMLRDM